ncbi:Ger(x)C family spore germination protein [Orenia marismortui]|uniref:Ger(x)C family spore germination protein n=1 Tax=Orenia marismortui TaxID=46469 RepID=UPI00037540D5|nr:Ger(x)C family spore germination protein [Orenia marismortui]
MNKDKIINFSSILILTLLLSGCWNYKEVNNLSIVSGVAVDLDKEDNKYIVSVENIVPKGGTEIKLESEVISLKGDTIFEAIRDLIMKNAKRLYWSHATVAIFSEELAKDGLISALDFFYRDSEVRADMYLLIANENSAKDLFYSKIKLHTTSSIHLAKMMQAQGSVGKFEAVELWEFQDALIQKGISPVIPLVKLAVQKEEKIPKVIGMAVFKDDKMVGKLDEIESRSLLFLKNQLSGGIIVIKDIANSNAKVTLEIFDNQTNIKPVIRKGEIIMQINIETNVGVAEITKNIDVISKEGRKKLKEAAEKLIKYQVNTLINKVEKNYQSDIFGFGEKIRMEIPQKWKEIEKEWETRFSSLNYETRVEVNIRSSALTSKPILLGE